MKPTYPSWLVSSSAVIILFKLDRIVECEEAGPEQGRIGARPVVATAKHLTIKHVFEN